MQNAAKTGGLTSITSNLKETASATKAASMDADELYSTLAEINRIRWGGLMGMQLLIHKGVDAFAGLSVMAHNFGASLSGAITGAMKGFQSITSPDTVELFSTLFEPTKDMFKSFGNVIGSTLAAPIELFEQRWGKAGKATIISIDEIRARAAKLKEEMANGSDDTFLAHLSLEDALSGLKQQWFTVWSTMREAAGGNIKAIKDGFKDFFSSTWSGIKELHKNFTAFFSDIRMELGAIALLIGTIASHIKLAFETSKLGNEVDKTSQKVGMSRKSFQEWGFILERCGVSASSLQTAMRSLTKAIGEGKDFSELGFNAEGMSREDVFLNAVKGLQKYSDETERAAKAQEIFGSRAFAELMPLINQSKENLEGLIRTYDALGYNMSDNAVAASAALQDSVTNLRYAFQGLKTSLSEGLLPILKQFVTWLTILIIKINIVIRAILGLSGDAAGGLDKAKDGAIGIGNGLGAAADNAKKLKRELLGFDEINRLSDDESSSSAAGAGAGFMGDYDAGAFANMELLSKAQLEKIDKFRKKIEGMKETLRGLVPAVMMALGAILILVGLFTASFPLMLSGLVLAGIGIEIGNINGAVPEGIGLMLDTISGFGKKVKDIVKDAIGFVKDKFNSLKEIPSKVGKFFGDAAAAAGEKLGEWKTTIAQKWDDIKNWFTDNVAPKFTKEYWKAKFDNIKTGFESSPIYSAITGLWGNIKKWFTDNVAPKFTAKYWTDKFTNIKTGFTNTPIYSAITGVWDKLKTWFNTNVKPIFTLKYWTDKLQVIKDAFSSLSLSIKLPHFSWSFSGAEAKGAIKTVLEKLGLPTSIPKLNVSWYAQGGITNGASIAGVGEAGKEAILPLERNTEWMDTLADRLADKINTNQNIVVSVDGDTLFDIVVDKNNSTVRRVGHTPLLI